MNTPPLLDLAVSCMEMQNEKNGVSFFARKRAAAAAAGVTQVTPSLLSKKPHASKPFFTSTRNPNPLETLQSAAKKNHTKKGSTLVADLYSQSAFMY